MSAGTGYRYLMETVAAGDGDRRTSTPMTRYYAQVGTPPGRWVGAGLSALDCGRGLAPGSVVSEEQLFQLLGMASDPVTGKPLGSAPKRAAASYRERVRAQICALPKGLSAADREARIAAIREAELQWAARRSGRAVAGFDLTFSVPKSVSAVWAVADARTQELIAKAHEAAISDTLAWAEREVFATRIGHGGATRVSVRGVIAAGFDHWDSRANDPHLHTHVVVANRVQAITDGKWRTLDSRALFQATVALSELHQGLLMDRLTGVLGVGWDGRARRRSPVVQWEITGVPDALRDEFSRRAADIDVAAAGLVEAYTTEHGRSPSKAMVLKLRQQATLETRPAKHLHSLAELTRQWRDRAQPHICDAAAWVRSLRADQVAPLLASQVLVEDVQAFAERALTVVAAKRTTFTRWNVYAETQRQLQGVRFAAAADRQLVGDRVCDAALGLAVLLDRPGEEVDEPTPSRLASRYTTREILDAEDRLLAAGRDTTGPLLALDPLSAESADGETDRTHALRSIAGSGRALDVLVGAAGTGKTTAMAELTAAWQSQFGTGSVVGLAPSAAAADVLHATLGLLTENTAKWLTEVDREPARLARLDQLVSARQRLSPRNAATPRIDAAIAELQREVARWRLHPDQLVIVDEASLAGTITLDRIVAQARSAGAKVLLVGDWAQLTSVEAGGAFGMLVRDRGRAPELHAVHRFVHNWEKQASLALRHGEPAGIDAYLAHDRIHDGDRMVVLDRAYRAWLNDVRAGKQSLLIAADIATVNELNARAHADLVANGVVEAGGVPLANGQRIAVGDRVVTRRNSRELTFGAQWVKNGDTWTVRQVNRDRSVTVQNRGGEVTLPAGYVDEHVELGYAATTHRAQGATVDTAHAIVSGPAMTREALYVAMTRGRQANHAYVVTDYTPDADTNHGPPDRWLAGEMLGRILANRGGEPSAHEIAHRSVRQLVASPLSMPNTRHVATIGALPADRIGAGGNDSIPKL